MMRKFRCRLWLTIALFPALLEAGTLQVIATADLHGELVNLAKLAPVLRHYPMAIRVDGGDFAQGNVNCDLLAGMPMAEAFNELHYDLIVPGNHDFELGAEGLAAFAAAFRGKMLALQCRDGKIFRPLPWCIVERSGFRCAVIGSTELVTTAKKKVLPEFQFNDPLPLLLDQALTEIRSLRPAPDAVIWVRHGGVHDKYGAVGSFLRSRPEIDAVICAHTHERHAGAKAGHTLAVQPGAHGEAAALIEIDFDDRTRRKLRVRSQLLAPAAVSDPRISAIGKRAAARARQLGRQPLHFPQTPELLLKRAAASDAAIFEMPPETDQISTRWEFHRAFPFRNRLCRVTVNRGEWQALQKEKSSARRRRLLLPPPEKLERFTVAVNDYLLFSLPTLRRHLKEAEALPCYERDLLLKAATEEESHHHGGIPHAR